MTMTTHQQPSNVKAEAFAVKLLGEARAQNKRAVLLVPQYSDTIRWKKKLSQTVDFSHTTNHTADFSDVTSHTAEVSLSLGVTVSTYPALVQDLWELFGDGRQFVSAVQRDIFLAQCLQDSPSLRFSSGVIKLLSELAQELPHFEQSPNMSASEHAIVDTLHAYEEVLQRESLCEIPQAVDVLSHTLFSSGSSSNPSSTRSHSSLTPYDVAVVVGMQEADLSFSQRKFFDLMGVELVVDTLEKPNTLQRTEELVELQKRLFNPTPECPLEPQGALRFAFATGMSAQKQLVVEEVERLTQKYEGQTITVACQDPVKTFDSLAERLNERGIGCAFRGMKPLLETDIGRAIAQILQIIQMDRPVSTFLASDYALSSFSGLSKGSARWCDARWRGNRLIDQNEILTDLSCNSSDALQGIIGSFENDRPTDAFDLFQTYLMRRTAWSESYKAEQLSALKTMQDFWEVAKAHGTADEHLMILLEGKKVGVSGEIGNAQIRFQTLEATAQEAAATIDASAIAGSEEPVAKSAAACAANCAALLVCDMTTDAYPIKDDEGAKETLLAKLGIESKGDSLDKARRTFYQAIETPTHELILERVLNMGDATPTYPSATFEEVCDCYRASLTNPDEMNKVLSIPQQLVPFSIVLSEKSLVKNTTGQQEQNVSLQVESLPKGVLGNEGKACLSLPRAYGQGYFEGLDLSPSQIETFLRCPYRWFVDKRISLSTPDEGFGSLEQGTFVHEVFQKFYEQFRAQGYQRVDAQTLSAAKNLFDRVFDICAEHQYEKSFRENRYVPLNAWEREQRNHLKNSLLEYLETEATLLPAFIPTYFEWSYGAEEPVRYAGCNIIGTVDRIDVNESKKQAVIIDYKTSISTAYDLHGAKETEEFLLPSYMQALIYSKVVQDLLGYTIVGTLYISPATGQIRGGFDAAVLGKESLPGLESFDRARIPFNHAENFEELLEKAESEVALKLAQLSEGDITPYPRDKDACTYCPAVNCPKQVG